MLGAFAAWAVMQGADAANWQMILSEPGRRMEIDRSSIRRTEDDKVLAWARIELDKPVNDAQSGKPYIAIEAHNRYDCGARSFTTLKRIYRKDEHEVLREEENKNPVDLPVRSGSLDEKILKIACRPVGFAGIRQDFEKTVKEANDATAAMRLANETTLQQEAARDRGKPVRQEVAKPAPAVRAATPPPRARAAAPATAPPRAVRRHARAAASAPVESDIPWSYDGAGGPEHWAALKPAYRLCGNGRRQSPIDLRDAIRVDQPAIAFNYTPSQFRIGDTDNALEVAVLGDNGLTLMGKAFRLVRVHFHRPGEHRIDGRAFEMSVHLEHRADDGQVAILAVNLVVGREHPVVQTLWNYLPLERYEVVAPPAATIDLTGLLPAERGYFHTMGSLTVPPCTEGVVWLVMQQAVEVSAEQLAIFGRLHAANARPLQAAGGRRIKASR